MVDSDRGAGIGWIRLLAVALVAVCGAARGDAGLIWDDGYEQRVPCAWSSPTDCGAGTYCKAPGCGAGVCVPVGTSNDPVKAAACGCDGINYWNKTTAAANGVAVAGPGTCEPLQECGLFLPPCGGGLVCGREQPNSSACIIADLNGICWRMPLDCGTAGGYRQCGAESCTSQCAATKSEAVFHPDASCPN